MKSKERSIIVHNDRGESIGLIYISESGFCSEEADKL